MIGFFPEYGKMRFHIRPHIYFPNGLTSSRLDLFTSFQNCIMEYVDVIRGHNEKSAAKTPIDRGGKCG